MTKLLRCSIAVILLLVQLTGCGTSPHKSGQYDSLNLLSNTERQNYERALALLAEDSASSAEGLLLNLSQSRPSVAEVWLNLALAHYQQAEWEQAQQALTQLLTLREATHQGHNLAGLVAVQQGEFERARQHYQRALTLQPSYTNALFNMALLQDVYLQDIEQAMNFYQRYIALAPDDEETKNWADNLQYSLPE